MPAALPVAGTSSIGEDPLAFAPCLHALCCPGQSVAPREDAGIGAAPHRQLVKRQQRWEHPPPLFGPPPLSCPCLRPPVPLLYGIVEEETPASVIDTVAHPELG